jgi:hypothetical protein
MDYFSFANSFTIYFGGSLGWGGSSRLLGAEVIPLGAILFCEFLG